MSLDVNTRLLFYTTDAIHQKVLDALPHIWREHQYRNELDREQHRMRSNRVLPKSMFLDGIGIGDIEEMVYSTIWHPTYRIEQQLSEDYEICYGILKR